MSKAPSSSIVLAGRDQGKDRVLANNADGSRGPSNMVCAPLHPLIRQHRGGLLLQDGMSGQAGESVTTIRGCRLFAFSLLAGPWPSPPEP